MPRLITDLGKIEANARLVNGMLEPFGVRLVGVTKSCLGNWHVARAMLAGGAAALADSRAASIARLRRNLPGTELVMLRSQTEDELGAHPADLYYVSSVAQAEALLPLVFTRPLRLCLVVETGDGREGILPEQAAAEAVRLAALPGVIVSGIATNAACAGDAPSLSRPLRRFREAGEKVLRSLEPYLMESDDGSPAGLAISAGGSGLLGLLFADENGGPGDDFGWLTELRCGEALLLGRVPRGSRGGALLPGAHRDAFILEAPVLEVAARDGSSQVLAGIGIQDIGAGTLEPLDRGLKVTQATSDYLALSGAEGPAGPLPEVGDRLAFIPDYYALLGAMTSPFVEKELIEAGTPAGRAGSPADQIGSEDSVTES